MLAMHGVIETVKLAQVGLNVAMMANPVGLVTAGIIALIAAGYALYKNWDTVTAFVSNGWETIKTTASNAVDTVGEVITHLPYYAGYAVGAIVGWFMQLPGRIIQAIEELPDDVMSVFVSCESAGSTFISEASSWGSQAVDGIIQWFSDLPGRLTAYVSSAWESAKAAVGNFKIGFQAGNNGEEPDTHNAYGGIYPRGEFITTFAEKSPEAAIPLDGSHRSISLWEKTGSMIGAFDNKNRLSVPANARKETNISVDFKPNITIQGNADETVIQNTMQLTMNQLKRMLQEIKRNERRVVYE